MVKTNISTEQRVTGSGEAVIEKISMPMEIPLYPQCYRQKVFKYGYVMSLRETGSQDGELEHGDVYDFADVFRVIHASDVSVNRRPSHGKTVNIRKDRVNPFLYIAALATFGAIFIFVPSTATILAVLAIMHPVALVPATCSLIVSILSMIMLLILLTVTEGLELYKGDNFSFKYPIYMDGTICEEIAQRFQEKQKKYVEGHIANVKKFEEDFNKLTGKRGKLKWMRAEMVHCRPEPALLVSYIMYAIVSMAIMAVGCFFLAQHIVSIESAWSSLDTFTTVAVGMAIVSFMAPTGIIFTCCTQLLKVWNPSTPDGECEGEFEFYIQENEDNVTNQENSASQSLDGEAGTSTVKETTDDQGSGCVPTEVQHQSFKQYVADFRKNNQQPSSSVR